MSKRARSPSVTSELYKSSPIDDRSSRFIAYYSPRISVKELQRNRDVSTAMHRIAAWRKLSTQRSLSSTPVYDSGHDDDGEKYGGKTLEKVLISVNITGAIVVARWYGGVLLGPVRFDHIRNCATEAITKWRMENARPVKQMKVEDENVKIKALIAILKERDQSISVLRGLLTEKKGEVATSQDAGKSGIKSVDYGKMPLPALEKLEHVRDATIGWILKEIEKLEEAAAAEISKTVATKGNSIAEVPQADLDKI